MTRQPMWETVYASDSDALHIDTTGVYRPELTIVEDLGQSAEELDGKFYIFRFPLDVCTYDDLNDILSDNPYHPYMAAWFAGPADRWNRQGKLHAVADSCGMRYEDLITLLCSEDPRKLALGYLNLVGWFGPHEFDHYADNYRTEAEATEALS